MTADVGRVAVQGESFDGAEGIRLACVADHVEQEIEGWRLASGTDSAEEHLAEFGVALTGERFLEEWCGAGQPGGSKSEGGLFGDGSELGLEEVGDEGQGLVVFQLEKIIEGLADDFGFGVALAGFQAKKKDGLVTLHLGDGADGVRADGEGAIGESVNQVAQDLASGNVGTRRQGERAGAAECGGGVGFPAPDGLHLNVMDAAEEGRGFTVIEGDEGFGDGVLSPALRIALDGLFEEAVEGAEEVGEQVFKAELGGDFGGFGNDEIDTVGKGFFEGGDGLGGRSFAEEIEAFDFGFDLAVGHRGSVYSLRRRGEEYLPRRHRDTENCLRKTDSGIAERAASSFWKF